MSNAVAILATAGRFPGARSVEEFWRNLVDGVESIRDFGDDELAARGVSPAAFSAPGYVKAAGLLEDADLFDAEFFGISPYDARLMCPQHRIFLECGWEALERAGYDPFRYDGRIGVFSGSNPSTYLLVNLQSHPGLVESIGHLATVVATDKDYIPTRLSYKLNLRGPSLSVNTACSTSLVAVHLACSSLLNGECDMALAGAVTVLTYPGYPHQPGSPLSPDGRCRAFDVDAAGTGLGSGVGLVVLKLLDRALEDGDQILAVILGSALNNDGATKVSYTAPSPVGQEEVIAEALTVAGVDAATVSYIEAHGTGTALGDPLEVQALARVFRGRATPCGIGSTKTNIGHLGAAAGLAGLIKTVCSLQHRRLAPSLNFTAPNPRVPFADSPFFVVDRPMPWTGPAPLRAGVSAFGFGGTNAHVVIEQAPDLPALPASSTPQVLLVSARTRTALAQQCEQLAAHLASHPEVDLGDVAFTLAQGRHAFRHRCAVVVANRRDAPELLRTRPASRASTGFAEDDARVAFLLPGMGPQHVGMGRALYDAESTYRREFDRACEILRPLVHRDIRELVFGDRSDPRVGAALDESPMFGAAIASTSWAVARQWQAWGVEPAALLGYSTGEYVAAALSGVLTLEDALALLVHRLDLIDRLGQEGRMASVPLPADRCASFAGEGIEVAADNGPVSVVAGPSAAIDRLLAWLDQQGTPGRRLQSSGAYHSSRIEPAMAPFRDEVAKLRVKAPAIPYVSAVTGTWIRAEDVVDPDYWVRHMRQAVRFGPAFSTLAASHRVIVEAGPGMQMTGLARQHGAAPASTHLITSSLPHPADPESDHQHMLLALGRVWTAGVRIGDGVIGRGRRRVLLPTYPFERQSYWVAPRPADTTGPIDNPLFAPLADHARRETPAADPHSLPTTATEELLCRVWAQCLGLAHVGVDDAFTELGGTSLLALQMIVRLPLPMQARLRLSDLFELQTVRRIAARLDGGAAAAPETTRDVIALRPGERPAVFCPHALMGGTSMLYGPLVSRLTMPHAVFGLDARGLSDDRPPRTTIEDMAAAYIDAMRSVQAAGPYQLLGYSIGGLIAYEMSRQLAAAGEDVALMLLDASAFAQFEDMADDRRRLDRWNRGPVADTAAMLAFICERFGRPIEETAVRAHRSRDAQIDAAIDGLIGSAAATRAMPGLDERADRGALRRLLSVALANLEAARDYRPQSFPGDIVFCAPLDADPGLLYPIARPEAFWARLAGGGFELRRVPGNHLTMMDAPHVAAIGSIVDEWLAGVRT